MTHQYESEILNKLMERDGFNIPSSVPPYESEIKAYLINQVKQAYPKLTDYEAEWLLYNYTKHLPADFPISSVSNVTEASFENVVPFAYQSAILKGMTLVNVVRAYWFEDSTNYFVIELDKYKIGQSYMFIMFDAPSNISQLYVGNGNSSIVWHDYTNEFIRNKNCIMLKLTCPSNYDGTSVLPHFRYLNNEHPSSINNIKCMLVEYQEGMENWDIPYFEGMQSVKMPVLKTTGKNLWDNKIFENCPIATINNDGSLTLNGTLNQHWMFKYTIDKGTYNSSAIGNDNGYIHVFWGGGDSYFQTNKPFNIAEQITRNGYIAKGTYDNINIKLQLEQGSTTTSYEPYKSNILTANEPVELRGVGAVKDELNLLTGEYVQRVGEVVLDGSDDEEWEYSTEDVNFRTFHMKLNGKQNSNNFACDKLLKKSSWDEFVTGVWADSGLIVTLSRNKANSLIEFRNWLSQNPLTVQYELATESVKTVDLASINEKGESVHFMPIEGTMNVQSSGEIIQPTFDMSVPVEATTQNLASFIDLEMEE